MRWWRNRWGKRVGGHFRAFKSYNLKRSQAADPLQAQRGCHIGDNHKSQEPQAWVRHTISRKIVTPRKGGAAVDEPSECA
jgi:hypothetical protein